MKTYTLDLSDTASARLVYHTTFLKEVSIMCDIPADTNCVKVIGTINFKSVVFDKKFYNAFKGKIDILDLSELKSSSSYSHLKLGLNQCSEFGYGGKVRINEYECLSLVKEIILPDRLENMPMIRGLQELNKIVGLGLNTFNNETRTDYRGGSNLSDCPKLEEIVFGSNIKNITLRNSTIKRINILETNGELQLEPYGMAYNKELEEVHIPQGLKKLPTRLFEGCTKLKTITGGNDIEEIGFGAFGGCTNLHSVPFKIELLKENQFISYDEWMQYEPIDHQTKWWNHGDCAHCPKGKWSEEHHRWESGCNYSIQEYCRDNEQQMWKPYKKGVVLRNGDIWCFDDFTYYKRKWTKTESELLSLPGSIPKWVNVHKYVEFISPSITFISEGDHVNINYNPQDKKALELTFPCNKLAETIDFYFEDISYEHILDEITRKVDGLDIDVIIDSYETKYSHEYFKMNSDTEGERYRLDRDAIYTDEYLAKLLPPIHDYYDDRTACDARYPDHTNPYKKIYNFEQNYSTFDKNDDTLPSSYGIINISRDAENLKNKDAEIRKDAREKYNRKDHIDYLVNCRISEILNKKMEIESRLHIRQAENESYNHSR
jgi:hypothetical protein